MKRATKLSLKERLRKKRKIWLERTGVVLEYVIMRESYPDKLEIKSHVQILKFHRFRKCKGKRKRWQTVVNKGRENFVASNESRICSNHFVKG